MKQRDLAELLNRAAAALETPDHLSDLERDDLVEDLVVAAKEMEPKEPEQEETPLGLCGVQHNGMACQRAKGHRGAHQHMGVLWTDAGTLPEWGEILTPQE